MMQNDVVITTDKNISKKIWVSNLIGNTTFYAVRNAANEEKKFIIFHLKILGDML
jgi:hypothetical protein